MNLPTSETPEIPGQEVANLVTHRANLSTRYKNLKSEAMWAHTESGVIATTGLGSLLVAIHEFGSQNSASPAATLIMGGLSVIAGAFSTGLHGQARRLDNEASAVNQQLETLATMEALGQLGTIATSEIVEPPAPLAVPSI